MKQITSHLLMIRPTNFGFNEQAFETNKFQNRPDAKEINSIQPKALNEFDAFVDSLKKLGVNVNIFEDFDQSITPDSIFPNNWISCHQSGSLLLYPMAVENRRNERRKDIIESLASKYSYVTYDFSHYENQDPQIFLEGTGSVIFDHQNKLAFAAISPRTNLEVLNDVSETIGYTSVPFKAFGKTGELIYHTNVMMCIGDTYVIIGTGTIDIANRESVMRSINECGKEIIELSNEQVYDHFAGNMLQVQNDKGESILVMSKTAFLSLDESQKEKLDKLNDHILSVEIPTIERIGGGSARCMLAELFLPEHS